MENRQPQITFNITGGTQNNVGSQISEQHNTFTGNDMKTQSVKASAGNAGNGQNGMSSLLSTPEAQKLWLKAIAAGWVDEDHQPTARLNSKNSQAMFANVMATRLNLPKPIYAPFEELWHTPQLQNSYSSVNQMKYADDLRREIMNTFRE